MDEVMQAEPTLGMVPPIVELIDLTLEVVLPIVFSGQERGLFSSSGTDAVRATTRGRAPSAAPGRGNPDLQPAPPRPATGAGGARARHRGHSSSASTYDAQTSHQLLGSAQACCRQLSHAVGHRRLQTP
eukprot:11526512-Heterocapsa_arctica.AAC.1